MAKTKTTRAIIIKEKGSEDDEDDHSFESYFHDYGEDGEIIFEDPDELIDVTT